MAKSNSSHKNKPKKLKTDAHGRVIRHTSLPKDIDDKLVEESEQKDRKISEMMRIIITKHVKKK